MKLTFWRALFYVSWTVLAIWLVLKVTGIINTPVWLEYGVPIASVILGILGVYRDILNQLNRVSMGLARLSAKLDHIDRDVEYLKQKA